VSTASTTTTTSTTTNADFLGREPHETARLSKLLHRVVAEDADVAACLLGCSPDITDATRG
jgi:hypothetical protein